MALCLFALLLFVDRIGEMFQLGDAGLLRGGDHSSAAQSVVPMTLFPIRFLPDFWLLIVFEMFLARFITFLLFRFGVLPTYTALLYL